jgi:hypothetical protein
VSCFQVDVLISQFLDFIFERGDVSLEWLRSASEVGHGAHDACSFDCGSDCALVSVAEEAAIATLDVAVYGEELPQQLDVAPVDIVLLYLPQVLLPLLVAVQRLEVMPQRLVWLELVVRALNCELAGAVVGSGIKLALPEVFEFVQQVGSPLGVNKVGRANARIGGVSADVLPESDVDDVFDGEPVVGFEIDFAGLEVVLDELEEGINFERQSFLRRKGDTCDFDNSISSRERPVSYSYSIFLVISLLICIAALLP